MLALDYGTKRIGLAVSDLLRLTAQPVATIETTHFNEELPVLVEQFSVEELVVGLPVSLDGTEGAAAAQARALAASAAKLTGLPVTMVDERFTTRIAESAMLEAGVKRRNRRNQVDRLAATILLQGYLDGKR